MEHPGFFHKAGPFQAGEICKVLSIEVPDNFDKELVISDIKPLTSAGPSDISYFEDKKLIESFKQTKAGICLVKEQFATEAPEGVAALIVQSPQEASVKLLSHFYPQSMRSQTSLSTESFIDETAVIEDNVEIEYGAIIGKEAHIGSGSRISAGSVIGYRVHLGRDCMIGPNVTITHSLIGDAVTIHAGVAIGQDGFGYIMGAGGHQKIPQIGRVIIQDKVEIGANTTVDRGALADTIIGEGTKIDNLVQIAHNVVIGSHAVIVSQTGISGSTKLGDFVVMGGQTGTVGHIEIGAGAQIAASSKVNKSVPAGARYGGTPAKPMKKWFKEIIALERLAETKGSTNKPEK